MTLVLKPKGSYSNSFILLYYWDTVGTMVQFILVHVYLCTRVKEGEHNVIKGK